uniref:SMB domain-containing protein n=1 Tax=Globodera pallida TaxID=36090 RepID=A0A183C285_GLOPA
MCNQRIIQYLCYLTLTENYVSGNVSLLAMPEVDPPKKPDKKELPSNFAIKLKALLDYNDTIQLNGLVHGLRVPEVELSPKEELDDSSNLVINLFHEALEFHEMVGKTVMRVMLNANALYFNSSKQLNKGSTNNEKCTNGKLDKELKELQIRVMDDAFNVTLTWNNDNSKTYTYSDGLPEWAVQYITVEYNNVTLSNPPNIICVPEQRMIGKPCRPLFLLLFCLTLLFFTVALKAEIGNLELPHSPSLKNVAIAIESDDQSSSDGKVETGTMTVPQLAPESGFGINFLLVTASLFLVGLLEVAVSAFVGNLKSKFRPLLLILCCLNVAQLELPPQLQRAKECQEVKALCPCGYGKCIRHEWHSASPCCVANYTFECCVPYKRVRHYPMQRPVFTLCLNFEKDECRLLPAILQISMLPQYFDDDNSHNYGMLSEEFCQNKSIIKAVCTECDAYRCISNSVGFSDSGCCRNDHEFRCCFVDRLITKQPTTTTSKPFCTKALIKALCPECDSYRCIPNIGFRGSDCCDPDHQFRCCSRDEPLFKLGLAPRVRG